MDTFDDLTPILEDTSGGVNSSPELESFDDMTPILEDENEDKEQDKASDEEKTEEKDESKQTDLLDEEEEGEEDSEKEKEDEPKEEKEDEKSDELPEPEEKPEGKELLAKMGEDTFKVNENMTFKQKVDGKTQEVTMRQLLDDFSGRESWDKKFSEIDEQSKENARERDEFKHEYDEITGHIDSIAEKINDIESDPMEALYYLLDLTGGDKYDFYKRVMEHNLDDYSNLSNMTQTERDLHLSNKKLEFIEKRDESYQAKQEKQQTETELYSQVSAAREAQGVSEEMFEDAFEDLANLGYDKEELSVQQVIQWAKTTPHLAKAEELMKPHEKAIDNDAYDKYISDIAVSLRDNPEITPEEISEIIAKQFGVDSKVKALEKKVLKKDESSNNNQGSYGYGKRKAADHVESFDDFD